MERIVRGAALVAIGSVVMAGCSADGPARDSQEAALIAAVLSPRDMPRGFLPAQDQRVFGGLSPRDPDCRRLLALADLDDLRARSSRGAPVPPQAHAVFYRAEPGSTMAEHLITLSPAEARNRIEDVRRAVAGCPLIGLGSSPVRVHRQTRPPGQGRDRGRRTLAAPGHRRAPWHRPRHGRGGRVADRPGAGEPGEQKRGGLDRYEGDEYGRDEYGRDEYGPHESGRDDYGRQESGRQESGRQESGREGPGHDGLGRYRGEQERPAPRRVKRGRSGSGAPGPGEPGSGEPGRDRSGPAESGTGRGEGRSAPGGSGHGLHGGGRFGVGFGPGYGVRARRPALLLHRAPLALPGLGGDVYGVRYSGRVGHRYEVHFDLVMAEVGGRLLVMEQPVVLDRGRPRGDSILRIVTAALRKLREATP